MERLVLRGGVSQLEIVSASDTMPSLTLKAIFYEGPKTVKSQTDQNLKQTQSVAAHRTVQIHA